MGKRYERRRVWKLGKQAAFRCYRRTKQDIEKAENEKQGLSAKKIKKILNCCESFAGCFARDELKNLSLCSFPIYLIVNTDTRGRRGKHWIAIYVSRSHVELFDSLGLIHRNRLPIEILTFIQRLAISRKFEIDINGCLVPGTVLEIHALRAKLELSNINYWMKT